MEPLQAFIAYNPYKFVISKYGGKEEAYYKISITWKESYYQVEQFTRQQVFHQRLEPSALPSFLEQCIQKQYRQINAWTEKEELTLLISKKGRMNLTKSNTQTRPPKESTSHNKAKQYILPEGTPVPPLVDMGIFTKTGKVVQSMYDKFRQINRFIEIIDDAITACPKKELHIIDFGCGKSYLTFILYYYLTEIRGIDASITGLDLKAAVIDKCNEAAKKYGYHKLHFELGDINGYCSSQPVDMVITLHACDTATDYALYNAILWKASMIFSVPCCQHELNQQIKSDRLSLLTHYGIIKERTAALMTDAIRGSLLEYSGYKTQLLEFIDLEHTPKNILIRAVLKNTRTPAREAALSETRQLMEEFHLCPTLYRLLFPDASF